jgi:hypothetical protein
MIIYIMTTSFWLKNPNILFKTDQISNIWPSREMSFNEKLNSISRMVILLTFIGYLFTKNNKVLLSGILSLGSIIVLYKMKKTKNTIKESFTDNDMYTLLKPTVTEPTPSNPLMNVLLPEINENPNRNPAAPSFFPKVEEDINNKTKQFIVDNFKDPSIEEKLFKDLGDCFNFEQSMHAWHPMPNTTIPNDQKSFAEYCYGDMTSCKESENNEMSCLKGMPTRWV